MALLELGLNLRFKVRNQNKFMDFIIPSYEVEARGFDKLFNSEAIKQAYTDVKLRNELDEIEKNFMEITDNVIRDNGLSLNSTIVYRFAGENEIECLGIDDGYESYYNSINKIK